MSTGATRTIEQLFVSSGIRIEPGLPICQTDLPLDWYQEEFKPYAEEYLALPDRTPESVLPWMDRYLEPARKELGPKLLLLAHYYMGGEIVKLVEHYGGRVADSYELALQARKNVEAEFIVESAVHFMADAIATLAHPHQQVFITNPRAGCTLEMFAKEHHVAPAVDELRRRYGDELTVVAYMNTSGRVKALAGESGGAVCTSSNAKDVLKWALAQKKRVLFVPDKHLGRAACWWCGIPDEQQYQWGGGDEGMNTRVSKLSAADRDRLDRARVILWGSYCGVHTIFRTDMVDYWRARGFEVHVHPESPLPVVQAADGAGSTKYLWNVVANAKRGAKLAIATEGHFVRNARDLAKRNGAEVVHLADIPDPKFQSIGCGCATMSRNDPPHLVAMVDLLRKGKAPEANRVEAGDVVDEISGARERLAPDERATVVAHARKALERMVEITEAAKRA
ncbi:MAG TPA: quinolinate synthase NadA [Planctomycetota bacterium]|nr:quinolinate synthase NadA [Planctomycetota bacterium]